MILLLFFLSLTLTEARCPLNAIESTEYDSCYLHGPIKADWEGAEEICQLLGGHLPSIKDQAQNAYITKIMDEVKFESLWIGGQYNGTAWTWSDGTDFSFVHFLGAASYAAKGYATSILLDDPAPGYSGYWQSENMDFTAQPFICQIPRCNSKGHSAKSILKMPKVLTFSSLTNSWYYAYKQGFAKPKEAEANCAALGGHLPSVHSAFENSDLLNILIEQTNAQTDFSLGLFSDLNGANFKFSDGTVFGYSNWAPGEPKQLLYSEDSAFSSKTGLWSTLGDSQRAPDQEALLYACAFPEKVNYCA